MPIAQAAPPFVPQSSPPSPRNCIDVHSLIASTARTVYFAVLHGCSCRTGPRQRRASSFKIGGRHSTHPALQEAAALCGNAAMPVLTPSRPVDSLQCNAERKRGMVAKVSRRVTFEQRLKLSRRAVPVSGMAVRACACQTLAAPTSHIHTEAAALPQATRICLKVCYSMGRYREGKKHG